MHPANCKKKFVLFVMCLHHLPQISLASQVFVVTPASDKLQINEGRSAPFYYHNWMRRMDAVPNSTTTTTTTRKPKVKTPDLIFAEFESENSDDDMKKSLRKLLQKEHVRIKSSTMAPIVVEDEPVQKSEPNKVIIRPIIGNEGQSQEETNEHSNSLADYYAMLKNVYDSAPSPVYIPSTTPSTTASTTTSSTTTSAPMDVQNIWHIIDSEKTNQFSGSWEEAPLESDEKKKEESNIDESNKANDEIINENFALPGFNTSPGNAGENESRAIRTEPNFRFPYVNLKTFQLKNNRKPMIMTNKKGSNNLYTSLDNFRDINYPVRGEAQDVVPPQPSIERYNPAQPYLPSEYGSKSKQTSSFPSGPVKTMANLVPPPPPKSGPGDSLPPPTSYESFPPYPQSFPVVPRPRPPPPPKASSDNFLPPPSSYESFPPYPQSFAGDSNPLPSIPPSPSPMSPSMQPPPSMSRPPASDDDSDSGPPPSDNNSDTGPGYNYNMPPQFLPTSPPDTDKPFSGYSYDKPMKNEDSGSMDMAEKPHFTGYHYNKPPPQIEDSAPHSDHGYHNHHYHGPHSYNPPAPSDDHDSDYPELIFDKHHGNSDDSKGGDDSMKGGDMKDGKNGGGMDMNSDDMGMPPPPPPPDMDSMKPDHDYPHDFHGDFKYHDDFDDHYHDHHHHYHTTTTTTTTTTEMPRVNRYSYYYLGKKLYYLPLYFSVYFIIYVGALIIKAVLRHKIVYPNSWRPNDYTASFFSKRSVDGDTWNFSGEKLLELTRLVSDGISEAADKYMQNKKK
ncbi:hypothetical protein EVAR_46611_1 [Eumeta japonica]|uniref:Uncharacterized protein n=1 Tax=Eumeta variegata TaxID=151549 RepID=A0A4C1Z8G3_EUMVA|nr:hypothetical protein EVAR_46611_1 [Eumeta japonica]